MGYVLRRIEVYPKAGDGWATEATVLTEASFPVVRLGWGKIKDSFSFTLPRGKQYFANDVVNFQALVRIYLWRDTPTFSPTEDLVMEGIMTELPQTVSDDGNVVTVKGFNFGEVFFDNQIPLDQTSKTWVEMSRAVLEFLNGNSVNSRAIRRAYWHPDNPTTKSDGSAFPSKTLVLNFITVASIFERITTDEFTGDGEYVWYLDFYRAKLSAGISDSATSLTLKAYSGAASVSGELLDSGVCYIGTEKISWTGRLGSTLTGVLRGRDGTTAAAHSADDVVLISGQYHFKTAFKSSTPDPTLLVVQAQTSSDSDFMYNEVFEPAFTKDRDAIKNYIIYNCGTDLYGKAVESLTYDLDSMSDVGPKQYYATEETGDIFVNTWNKERFRNKSQFNPGTDSLPKSDFPTTYPYVLEDGTSVSSDEAFNERLRVISVAQGKVVADGIIKTSQRPRYSVVHNARFTNQFTVGQLIDCQYPSRNINRKLRIVEITHSVEGTSLTLDEDISTATLSGG